MNNEEYKRMNLGDIKNFSIFKIKEGSLTLTSAGYNHINDEDLYMIVRHEKSSGSKYLVNITKGLLHSSNPWEVEYEIQIIR